MNTTTPRARAGRPYVPPFPTRRVMPEQVAAMPIDFVLPDEDEQAVRDGFDRVMKMPISKPAPDIDSTREYSADVRASSFAFWAWSALIWTACWLGIGYFFGRYVS